MLLRHAWTSSRPRPPERSSEPGGLEHGEAGVQGAGPGQTPKVGVGKHVGWDITQGCPPSLAGDEEHRALVMLAERVCDGFWQRWLIKIRGVVGSQMWQQPGRVSGLAGSLCFARYEQPFPKSIGGPGGEGWGTHRGPGTHVGSCIPLLHCGPEQQHWFLAQAGLGHVLHPRCLAGMGSAAAHLPLPP